MAKQARWKEISSTPSGKTVRRFPPRAWCWPGLSSWVLTSVLLLVGCSSTEAPERQGRAELPTKQPHPERRGIGLLPLHDGPRQLSTLVEPRRSLAVTDQVILNQFSFHLVMNQLVIQSGVTGLTPLRLYRQWWDTANQAPGLGLGPHCNDSLFNGVPSLNSFVYTCPRAEGGQIHEDPFSSPATNPTAYIPIGLFNRFDLASTDGRDCGEYRIIFARKEGQTNPFKRNLIIFEAVLPNPQPSLGLEGCRPVAQFWADLSAENDPSVRATRLQNFYFNGLSGFLPVIHINNYGNRTSGAPTGQVRTNQFLEASWTLREFKVRKSCSGSCALRFIPVTVKTNPGGLLFSPTSTHPLKSDFQGLAFPGQVPALARSNINTFTMFIEDRFNSGQSNSQGTENNYVAQFTPNASTLRGNIQSKLTAMGSSLTPDHIVRRAMTQSCAGCHQHNNAAPNNDLGNGMIWPASLGFVHVSEVQQESGPDGQRFRISPALTDVFLPHRRAVLESFLNSPVLACGPTAGNWTGCGEDGCSVCSSALKDFPCYFNNHPACRPASVCSGSFTTCNSACPMPTTADRCVSIQCGNGVCEAGEDSLNCPADCGGGPVCGNGICEPAEVGSTCIDCNSTRHQSVDDACDGGEASPGCPGVAPPGGRP